MERTFRLKLFGILGVAALGLIVITIVGGLVESRVERHLSTIREQYIPKIGLAERLQSAFERVSLRLQDAAQANDLEVLDEARRQKLAVLEQIAATRDAIDASHASALRAGIDDYFATAEPVTRKMIRGDSVESMVDEVERMQTKQATVRRLISEAAEFDEAGLGAAFHAATEAQDEGARLRLVISLSCLALVLGLSLWIMRGLYGSLANLADGFRRFGEGDFLTPIPAKRNDELGAVARDANQMAERLRRLADERERGAWIKAGQVGLADELRGELTPEEVGARSLAFLARYVGAPLGAIYYTDPDEVLRFLGGFGVPAERRESLASFALGDGLLGEAARSTEITVVRAPVGHLPMRSGLVEGDPRSLVLVPLVHGGKVRGIVELAVVAAWESNQGELMLSVRDSLAIAIEVARARAGMRALLAETQRQAAELLTARQGLEQKAKELARASTYKSQFLANMSHELRTPLNAILGFSELLYDGAVPPDSPQHQEFLGDITTSGRHLLQLINDILDLSKVEAGKLELQAEPISMTRTINEVVGILRATSASARVKLATAIDPAVDEVVLDPGRLKQVLYNYLSNAIKFSPPGSTVS
ncbi:MAG: GAF domain-containing protein, partial [Deltaproteobacteria bacterium]|nr:GAF domain-containing protein [Deltaproteobacteria bacterium]